MRTQAVWRCGIRADVFDVLVHIQMDHFALAYKPCGGVIFGAVANNTAAQQRRWR